jgi:hypothetical protein
VKVVSGRRGEEVGGREVRGLEGGRVGSCNAVCDIAAKTVKQHTIACFTSQK